MAKAEHTSQAHNTIHNAPPHMHTKHSSHAPHMHTTHTSTPHMHHTPNMILFHKTVGGHTAVIAPASPHVVVSEVKRVNVL